MKFINGFEESVTPEWRENYISYKKLSNIIESSTKIIFSKESGYSTIQKINRIKEKFLHLIELDFQKVEYFFKGRLPDSVNRYNEIKKEVDSLCCFVKNPWQLSPEQLNKIKNILPSVLDGSNHIQSSLDPKIIKKILSVDKKYLKAYKILKVAISEYYLFLHHVKKFQYLNSTGFIKLLTKFDNIFGTGEGEKFKIEFIEKSEFFKNTKIARMQKEMKSIYINLFSDGNKLKTMKFLKIPIEVDDKRKLNSSSFLLGGFVGGSVALLVKICWDLTIKVLPIDHRPVIILFSGQLMPILHVIFISLDIYVWNANGVNHKLIFEVNPRDNISYVDCLWFSLFLLFVWLIFVLLYINYDKFTIHPYIYPFISFFTLALFLFFPFNLFNRSSRKWMGIVIVRNFLTPAFEMKNADILMYDQFISQSQPFTDLLSYTPCMGIRTLLKKDINYCESPTYFLNFIVTVFPFHIRCIQCFRRFYDYYKRGNTDFVHVFNGLKYLSFIIVLIANLVYSLLPVKTDLGFWIVFVLRILSLCYFMFWDAFVDWAMFGTLKFTKDISIGFTLRPKIFYSRKIYYYLALIQNILIRLLSLIPPLTSRYTFTTYPYATLLLRCGINAVEVWRRASWTIFRVEIEQINNDKRLKVVRDISIMPFPEPCALVDNRLDVPVTKNQNCIDDIHYKVKSNSMNKINHSNESLKHTLSSRSAPYNTYDLSLIKPAQPFPPLFSPKIIKKYEI